MAANSKPKPASTAFAHDGPHWSASEGQVMNLGTYAVCALTCWLVLPVLYAIYRFLLTHTHVYQLTGERLLETKGLLSRTTDVLELYRVKDIGIDQPLIQRLFGRGTVVLVTSDRSTPMVNVSGIRSPHAFAEMLRELVERCRAMKGVREID
jgi:uncharacterized membrane protein YdbT with pleckstrin-like domain